VLRSPRTTIPGTISPWFGLLFLIPGLLTLAVGLVLAVALDSQSLARSVVPLAGLVFSGAGAYLLFGGLRARGRSRRRQRALAADPRRPWLAVDRWVGLETRSASAWALVATWGNAIYVTVFMALFGIVALSPGTPTFIRVVVALFSILVPYVLIEATYKTLQHWKWGRARLTFRRLPIRPGERIEGVVFCGRRVEPEGGFRLTLVCARDTVTTRRSGGKTEVSIARSDLFTHEELVSTDLLRVIADRGTAIPINLQVPADQPPSETGEIETTYWQLEVTAATPGIDLAMAFDLPVYSCADELVKERI
jgi:hypothetical protein